MVKLKEKNKKSCCIMNKKATKLQQTNGITVIPTMRDIITADSRLNGNTNIKKFLLNTCNFKEYMVN